MKRTTKRNIGIGMAFTGVGTIPGVAIAGYQQHKINQEKDKEISNLRRSTHKGIDQK